MKLRSALVTAIVGMGLSGVAMADVTGKVTFDGKAPAMKKINTSSVKECSAMHPDGLLEETLVVASDGALANVVVSIKNAPAGGKAPAEAAILDQKGCTYSPHVLAVMVGQPIKVRNDDPFQHNVHGLPEENPTFNFSQGNVDPGKAIDPMKTPEKFKVKCDVHPWMNARFAVFEHPYFAVSGKDGTFAIKGLPDGDYDVEFWHEKLGEAEGKVTVKGGNGEVSIKMKQEEEGDARPASEDRTVRLASLETAAPMSCCDAKESAQTAVAESK